MDPYEKPPHDSQIILAIFESFFQVELFPTTDFIVIFSFSTILSEIIT